MFPDHYTATAVYLARFIREIQVPHAYAMEPAWYGLSRNLIILPAPETVGVIHTEGQSFEIYSGRDIITQVLMKEFLRNFCPSTGVQLCSTEVTETGNHCLTGNCLTERLNSLPWAPR